jgi:hypothetical protein
MRSMPTWFKVVAVALIAWNLIGAYACIQQFRLGAEAMGPATDYDRALYAAMPVWYDWVFAAAEVTGVAGALALLLGHRMALPLFAASLVFVVVQFGYLFATSDIIAVKGVWTTYFPAFIAAVGLLQIGVARLGVRRGWLR